MLDNIRLSPHPTNLLTNLIPTRELAELSDRELSIISSILSHEIVANPTITKILKTKAKGAIAEMSKRG